VAGGQSQGGQTGATSLYTQTVKKLIQIPLSWRQSFPRN